MAESDPVRIIPHNGVDQYCGSFEVRFPGGNQFFYWDDIAGRRLRGDAMDHGAALAKARDLARRELAKISPPA